ncbi:MAG TPA: hypothetical protein VIY48_14350 [Candidatus Paceibacterota bacterium]
MKYRVWFTTDASASVDVEINEDQEALEEMGVIDPDTGDIDEDSLKEKVIEMAYDETPSLSAQASGWGQPWSMEIGEWEHDEEQKIERLDD